MENILKEKNEQIIELGNILKLTLGSGNDLWETGTARPLIWDIPEV